MSDVAVSFQSSCGDNRNDAVLCRITPNRKLGLKVVKEGTTALK